MEQLIIDDLVERAKLGTVTSAELDAVAAMLGKEPAGDSYRLLYILGRAGARNHEKLVSGFLDDRADPHVAGLALSILCTYWGLSESYRPSLHKFLRGVDWDVFGDLRRAAMTAAGNYLGTTTACDVLKALLDVVADSDELQRRFALEALARAMGDSRRDAMPRGNESVDTWAASAMSRAHARLNADC